MRKLHGYLDQSGSVGLIFASSFIVMLGLAALVIDLGHAYMVKLELRKAAEAGALAGARALSLPDTVTTPNWTNGTTTATSTVRLNFANGAQLSDYAAANVQAGYWDTRWTTATAPANLNGYTNPTAYVPVNPTYEIPAVMVTIAKTAGGTGSSAPITTIFASILGINSMTMQASAVAILPSPAGIGIGDAFPMAMPQSYVTTYWNQEPSVSFRITGGGGDGNWTSFLVDANNVPTIKSLIDNGNPTNLKIGDNIWIEPGVKTSVYDYAAAKIGQTVVMSVVDDSCTKKDSTPIVNFVAFQIEDAVGGSGKYIQGHFVNNFLLDSALGAIGTGFGTTSGPKLVL